jgi:hypothetical protein
MYFGVEVLILGYFEVLALHQRWGQSPESLSAKTNLGEMFYAFRDGVGTARLRDYRDSERIREGVHFRAVYGRSSVPGVPEHAAEK